MSRQRVGLTKSCSKFFLRPSSSWDCISPTILFLRKPRLRERITKTKLGQRGAQFLFSGWGFDWIYDRLLIRPLAWLARINREDFLDLPYLGIAEMSRAFNNGLSRTQSGRLRWYAAVIVIGAIITLTVVVFL